MSSKIKDFYVKRDKKKCAFFIDQRMPPELRHRALSLALPPRHQNVVAVCLQGNFGLPPTKIPLPATAHAGDSTLRQETILVTIEQTTWSIHNIYGHNGFQAWLESVDLRNVSNNYVNGFDAVKALRFPYFSRFKHHAKQRHEVNNDVELMLKCRNLESVQTQWAGDELLNLDMQTGVSSPKTVQQLRAEYRLDRMLNMRSLKELELALIRARNPAAVDVLQQLAAWFVANMPLVSGKPVQVAVR